jgi:hypothetical protein
MDLVKHFSFDRLLTAIAEWFLKLICTPAELLIHRRIGERYVGVSGLLSLLLLWGWAFWVDDGGPLYLLLIACIVRIVIMRVQAVRQRREGTPIFSRSCGEPLLERFVPLSPAAIRWIEPVAMFVTSLLLGFFSSPLRHYLETSSIALLILTAVRYTATYYRTLDAVDEQIELKLPIARVIDLPVQRPHHLSSQAEPLLPSIDSHAVPTPFLSQAGFLIPTAASLPQTPEGM